MTCGRLVGVYRCWGLQQSTAVGADRRCQLEVSRTCAKVVRPGRWWLLEEWRIDVNSRWRPHAEVREGGRFLSNARADRLPRRCAFRSTSIRLPLQLRTCFSRVRHTGEQKPQRAERSRVRDVTHPASASVRREFAPQHQPHDAKSAIRGIAERRRTAATSTEIPPAKSIQASTRERRLAITNPVALATRRRLMYRAAKCVIRLPNASVPRPTSKLPARY